MTQQENKFTDLFQTEFSYEEAQRSILFFLLLTNIRSGEYEGNEYVIRKLSDDTFVAFKEYILPDTTVLRQKFFLFTVKELWAALKDYTQKTSEELFELADLAQLLGSGAKDYFTAL